MPAERREKSGTVRFAVLTVTVFATAFLRLVPHPWNVSPMGALALFAGAHFRDRRWAFAVPVSAMFVTDVVLYATIYRSYVESGPGMLATTVLFVYGSYALIAALGMWLRGRKQVPNIALATISASVLFFAVTNFGVWLVSGSYPLTPQGLVGCYTAALPFFRNTLLSDAVFATVLFGGFALAEKHLPALREQPAWQS